jgi:hypothetical protein
MQFVNCIRTFNHLSPHSKSLFSVWLISAMPKRLWRHDDGPAEDRNVRFELPTPAPAPEFHDSPMDLDDDQTDDLANELQSVAPLPDFILNSSLAIDYGDERFMLSEVRQRAWLHRTAFWRDFNSTDWNGVELLGAGSSGIYPH